MKKWNLTLNKKRFNDDAKTDHNNVGMKHATLHRFFELSKKTGFTIVELLVVISIIGIVTSITIISYKGVNERAVTTSLKADLASASQQLKLYYQKYGSYPTALNNSSNGTNCPTTPTADNTFCIKASSGNAYTYSSNGTTYSLSSTNVNGATSNTVDELSTLLLPPTDCPTGFIPVPGSATYGTSGFCVMKYAASQVGASNVPQSVPSVLPWVSISQTNAIAYSKNVVGCASCHLITEAEWMTIVKNVAQVSANWSGTIYSGHNDNVPANAIAPDPSDANGYASTGNASGNQRRTLTLTNGEVIWDLSGNVYQWTSGQTNGITAQQPGIAGSAIAWREYTAVSANTNTPGLEVNPLPGGTGLSGASTWTHASNGIGKINSAYDDKNLYGFVRGGNWNSSATAGVFGLDLSWLPTDTNTKIGFRVAR